MTLSVRPVPARASTPDIPDTADWLSFTRLRSLARDPAPARAAWQRSPKCRGLQAAREGHVVEAIRLLEQARHDAPWTDPEVEANLSELHAIRRLERRLEVRPNDINTLLELGKAYFSQERSDDSLRILRRAVDLAPNCADAHSLLAMELHMRGALEEAATSYRRALSLNPREFNAVVYYADLLCGRPLGAVLPVETPVRVYAMALPIVNEAITAGNVTRAQDAQDVVS